MAIKLRFREIFVLFFVFVSVQIEAKSDEKSNVSAEVKTTNKVILNDGPALLFADDLKQIIEMYMFGICPQPYKSRWSQMVGNKKNGTTPVCDLDADQQELAGRLATLALRAHSVARTDCARFGAALANTLGELARTASTRHGLNAAANEKKRKLSKSQKAKIAAKQRTALAVKKKAAALAAAAAAKIAVS